MRYLQAATKNPEQDHRGKNGHGRVHQPTTAKQRQPVKHVVERPNEKRAEPAVADVSGDLPFVLDRRDQILGQQNIEEITNDLAEIVTFDAPPLARLVQQPRQR